jgi:hypothetical protein
MKLDIILTILFASFASESVQYNLQDSLAIRLVRYQGSSYNKTFYLSTVRASWMGAYQFCKSSGMHLATLNTQAEYQAVFGAIRTNADLASAGISNAFIGAYNVVPAAPSGWTWYDNGQKITYPLDWNSGEPNNYGNIEWCASFQQFNGIWGQKDHILFKYY